jgi:hypothetical protein
MATQEPRPIRASVRLTATERDCLRQAAADRGSNPSELIRAGLRLQGALPVHA